MVPVFPSMPSFAFCSSVMSACLPGLEEAKSTAACTLGSMEPGAKWPSPISSLARLTVRLDSHSCCGVLKRMATFSTAVSMMSKSASSSLASRQLAKSLSMTAPTPLSSPFSSMTGMPPPPAAMTTWPACKRARMYRFPRSSWGAGWRPRGASRVRRLP